MHFRILFSLPLILSFALPAVGAPAEAPDPVLARAGRSVAAPPRVLALYYGWYGTPEKSKAWANYDKVDAAAKKIGSQAHWPEGGPYDSLDPAVLQRQA